MKEQRSLRGKIWECRVSNDDGRIALEASRRGDVEARLWENPNFADLADPLTMKGMTAARDRILAAVANQERIMVLGDFDADGITATSALVHGLQALGALVSYRLPDRVLDSHGLKKHHVDDIVAAGVQLLITVDCGTNDEAEVVYAVEQGLEVIITDHHQVDERRQVTSALAVCNPVQPDCPYPHNHLAGVGVVFKLLQALKPDEAWLQPYLALAAIGTVADCVTLQGESRTLVQLGLKALNQNYWPGVRALLDTDDLITEETIGYGLAPMLNASSRLGEVQHAVQLFLGDQQKLPDRVAYLQQLNLQRREYSKDFSAQAQALVQKGTTAQVLYLADCPLGILGLVASKLVEQLHQPILVIAPHPKGGLHGSARGPKGAGLSTMLEAGSQHLGAFGGHDGAAGFRLEETALAEFISHVQQWYTQHPLPAPYLDIAAQVPATDLDLNWLAWQRTLAPFGVGNPLPIWQTTALKLTDMRPMGRDQNHARFTFTGGHEAVAFFATDLLATMKVGQAYELAVTLHENTWNGETKVQWQVVDVRN